MSFTLILLGLALLFIIFIIIKKPEVLKKDETQPFSLSNFSLKKTFIGDWKQFGTWILLMFIVWSYAHDTQSCREVIENIDEVCMNKSFQISIQGQSSNYDIDLIFDGGENGNTNNSWSRNQSISSNTIP